MGLYKEEKIVKIGKSKITDDRIQISKNMIENHKKLKNELTKLSNDDINSLLKVKLSSQTK